MLGADLKDDFLFSGFLVDGLAFGEEVSDGFFAIDVFAGAEGAEGGEGVPVVGCAHDHGIDVLPLGDFAKIIDGVDAFERAGGGFFGVAFLNLRLRGVAAALVRITNGEGLDFRRVHDGAEVAIALAAAADQAEGDAVAGHRFVTLRKNNGRGNDRRHREDG